MSRLGPRGTAAAIGTVVASLALRPAAAEQPADIEVSQPERGRFHTVLLAAPGFAVNEASAEFRLRAPDLTVVTQWRSESELTARGRVFVSLRLSPAGDEVRVEVITFDGAGFLRRVPADDASLRRAIHAAVSLLISIEHDVARVDVEVASLPRSSSEAEVQGVLNEMDTQLARQADTARPPEAAPLVTSRPALELTVLPPRPQELVAVGSVTSSLSRWKWGAVLQVSALGYAGAPEFAAPFQGAGIGGSVQLRSRAGAAFVVAARWLTRERLGFRLHRVRISAGGGYALRAGGFHVPVLAELGFEPWSLSGPVGPVSISALEAPAGASFLLDMGLRLEPAYEFGVPHGVVHAVRIGVLVHARGGMAFSEGATVVGIEGESVAGESVELFRLGGFELEAGLVAGFWFGPRR